MTGHHNYTSNQKNQVVGFVMESDLLGNRRVGVSLLTLRKEFVNNGKMNAYQLTAILRDCLASGQFALNGDLKYLFCGERDTITLG